MDGTINAGEVYIILLDLRFKMFEFLIEFIERLDLILQPLQIERQLLDGENGRIEPNILLNLLLELIEFCHSVIPLLHFWICRQVAHG